MKSTIRGKVALISASILFIAVGINTLVNSINFSRDYSKVLQSEALVIGQILNTQLNRLMDLNLKVDDLVGFEEQCQELKAQHIFISSAMVVNTDGMILFHNDPSQHGRRIQYPSILDSIQNQKTSLVAVHTDNEVFYDILIPVMDKYNKHIASTRITFPKSIITKKTKKMIVSSAGITAIVLLLGLLLLFFSLSIWVGKPIAKFIDAIEEIRQKGTESAQNLEVMTSDEIGQLGSTFNLLMGDLKESSIKIKSYTKELEEANTALKKEIEERKRAEEALTNAHNELEIRVEKRTVELKEANEKLKEEVKDRRHAEEALRESEEKYRNLFNNAQVGIYRTRISDGKLVEANNTLARMHGYADRADILGAECILSDNYVDPGTRENLLEILREHGEFRNFEARLYRKDKSIAWFRFSGLIFPEKKYVEGVSADITEEKRLEEQILQTQKMESIGTLAGGIAHDFNNILGIIVGNTELAMGDVPEWNPARKNLEEIRTASIRARDVVKQILAFSRQSLQEMKPVSFSPIIKDALKLLRSSIPTTIEIHQNISCESDTVHADPTQIHQVLINLCTNAAHAMGIKGGVLEVDLENIELDEGFGIQYHAVSSGKYLKLTVSDTGHGIEPKILDRIFDPYFTTKEVGEGSGMGLSVVHGIVKTCGGDILVDSELGQGTAFQVFFPCTESEPERKIEITVEIPRGSEKILFVDDEKAIVDTFQPMAERLGYKVTSRTSSIEGLEAFRANSDRFDLVITDYTMPNMNGMELAKKLFKLRPDIPIILCTGYSEHVNEDKVKANGIRALLMKPVVLSEIANTIRKVLDDE